MGSHRSNLIAEVETTEERRRHSPRPTGVHAFTRWRTANVRVIGPTQIGPGGATLPRPERGADAVYGTDFGSTIDWIPVH